MLFTTYPDFYAQNVKGIGRFLILGVQVPCQNPQSTQFSGFIRISKIKTPSPIPETESYDSAIRSPF